MDCFSGAGLLVLVAVPTLILDPLFALVQALKHRPTGADVCMTRNVRNLCLKSTIIIVRHGEFALFSFLRIIWRALIEMASP
jgi:hypothetical protein